MQQAKRLTWMIPLMLLVTFGLYNLPPVHERLAWRVDDIRTRLIYFFNPPDEAIFQPNQQVSYDFDTILATTRAEFALTLTPPPPVATGTPKKGASFTPTLSPTPLPALVNLEGFKYEDQHGRWNYCGPANLSMGLTFWGWDGNRDVVGEYVKPEDKDKNVMPYEMQDFVESQTQGMAAVVRSGGEIEVIKSLIAGGFPVLAEKGYYEYDYTGKLGWLGHYQFVTGYDDVRQAFIVQDTYIKDGKDHRFPYEEFIEGWRSFNYLFVVVYPQERQEEVLGLLGPWADAAWASAHALELAKAESQSLAGIDQFFAWFNRGSSHVALQEYPDAASAYDQAFALYATLPDDDARPFRMLWYQTGPYWAYFYSGRYQDVINLADTTLIETISEPVLEESFYWRALAREALGDVPGAITDLRESVRLNPNFGPGWEQLNRLGG
jgi:tetratricopeptide (TPR) repeat protein